MYKHFLIIILLFILIFSLNFNMYSANELFTEVDENNNLRLGNDYIVIIVNQNPNGQGRFAIETTGGAPFHPADENKPLIYGRPNPWPSYTTIWLDDQNNYVFGGSTARRAGSSDFSQYGEMIEEPYVRDNSIYTSTKINNILIEQILTIVKSSTTGLYDSVEIKYKLTNIGEKEHKVGLRVMLDTLLGENDGAPFRIGEDVVTTDTMYYKEQLPDFWLAFDSLSNPMVTSQGTFRGSGVTTPDEVYLSNWGSLADGPWDFDFEPEREFIRQGEFEIDSAIALYWYPEKLKPGQVHTYTTNYGLGGITIIPGLLSLGVTSPAEVSSDKDETFPIYAYIENTSEIIAENVRVELELPDVLSAQNLEVSLGDLKPGETRQSYWDVSILQELLPEKINYSVKVRADNTDSNQVTREVKFIAPPNLETSINIIDKLTLNKGRLTPNPFLVEAEISNTGGSTLYNVTSQIQLAPGLIPARKENINKHLGYLEANETVKVNWQIQVLEGIEGNIPLAIETQGEDLKDTVVYDKLQLPKLEPLIYFTSNNRDIKEGDYITVDLFAENIGDLAEIDLIIKYNPNSVKISHIDRGNVFIREGNFLPYLEADLSQEGQIHFKQKLPSNVRRGTFARIILQVKKLDKNIFVWGESNLIDNNNNKIYVELLNF